VPLPGHSTRDLRCLERAALRAARGGAFVPAYSRERLDPAVRRSAHHFCHVVLQDAESGGGGAAAAAGRHDLDQAPPRTERLFGLGIDDVDPAFR
jgi:hypothetical protein